MLSEQGRTGAREKRVASPCTVKPSAEPSTVGYQGAFGNNELDGIWQMLVIPGMAMRVRDEGGVWSTLA